MKIILSTKILDIHTVLSNRETHNNIQCDNIHIENIKGNHMWVNMSVDKCRGDVGDAGEAKGDIRTHKWSCAGMYCDGWPGKFPQNTCVIDRGMWGEQMGVHGY